MDENNSTTKPGKGQHLTSEERHEIEVRLKDKWTIYRIAKHLGRAYNTIKNEVERGAVTSKDGQTKVYKADRGQEVYLEHRQNSRRKIRCLKVADFLHYVWRHFRDDKWSLDACAGKALESKEFERSDTVCTRTLYRYVDLGFLSIRNIDLPEKLRRNTRRKRVREKRKVLGRSIGERPESVDAREEFGHWEIDSVLGKKGENEPVVIALTERKIRVSIWIKVPDHSAEAVDAALRDLFKEYDDRYREVFKSITADNGSEFTNLSVIEKYGVAVYFTHPYSSCEKGTVECHNRLLRRFIPKGKSIADYDAVAVTMFGDIINALPRKLLGYHTPEELFDAELDRIFAA